MESFLALGPQLWLTLSKDLLGLSDLRVCLAKGRGKGDHTKCFEIVQSALPWGSSLSFLLLILHLCLLCSKTKLFIVPYPISSICTNLTIWSDEKTLPQPFVIVKDPAQTSQLPRRFSWLHLLPLVITPCSSPCQVMLICKYVLSPPHSSSFLMQEILLKIFIISSKALMCLQFKQRLTRKSSVERALREKRTACQAVNFLRSEVMSSLCILISPASSAVVWIKREMNDCWKSEYGSWKVL